MSKLRFIHIELENGSDETLRAALVSLIAAPAAPAPAGGGLDISVDRALALPPANEEIEQLQPRRTRKAPAARKSPASKEPPADGTIPSRILEALAKKPMSSLELSGFLKLEPKQVYGPCHLLKKNGQIATRTDFPDGAPRYYIVKK